MSEATLPNVSFEPLILKIRVMRGGSELSLIMLRELMSYSPATEEEFYVGTILQLRASSAGRKQLWGNPGLRDTNRPSSD